VNLEQEHLLKFYLRGMGVDEEPKDVLKIDQSTGEIFVHKKIDYEMYPYLSVFSFEARDRKHNVDTELGMEIRILDINDHAPVFSNNHYETNVDESALQGETVTRVFASDDDDSNSANGIFTFTLVSVTPETDNVEFYITQNHNIGSISFKGCFDYEKAHKYTLLIEAKDYGDKIQLSSTTTVVLNIVDKNNHRPEIIGRTGPGRVKELETGVEVLRLQISDKDNPQSLAYKAKFSLHGDPENYFEIYTDHNTNEGILKVVKAMDYEIQTSRNVSITVQNEESYFSCEVKTRTSNGLWDLESREEPGMSAPYTVSIAVEDTNEPPEFVPHVIQIVVQENTYIKSPLKTLTAVDPDRNYHNSFHFIKGEDKDNWVNVDPESGEVTMAKMMDRESPYVKDNTYNVTVYVVDDDQPPKTGTGTLVIYVSDQNDNVPLLKVNTVSMCLSEKETMTQITAVDQDLPPYSAPFHYKLLGDVEGKWRIDPEYGTTVGLIREKTVYSGHYKIQFKILDNQGFGLVQNLSVTVCNCTITPDCHVRRSFTARPSLSVMGIILLAFLVLIVTPLMAFSQRKKVIFLYDGAPDGTLMKSNTEMPGTDCQVNVS
ncbi:cadherin-like protein 26 isoform X2, partial [Silurus asotus]